MSPEYTTASKHTQELPASILKLAEDILDRLGPSPARALMLLSGYEQGARGECRAKNRTIGSKLGVQDRQVRRLLAELRDEGLIVKSSRRIRWSGRKLTELGRIVVGLLKGVRFVPTMSGHMSAHNGEADHTPEEKQNEPRSLEEGGAIKASGFKISRRGGSLHQETWNQLARWIDESGRATSWARCKIAARSYLGLSRAIGRSREFRDFHRIKGARTPFSAEYLVALAIRDARRVGADFGSVESSMSYISAIVVDCLKKYRFPGSPAQVLR